MIKLGCGKSSVLSALMVVLQCAQPPSMPTLMHIAHKKKAVLHTRSEMLCQTGILLLFHSALHIALLTVRDAVKVLPSWWINSFSGIVVFGFCRFFDRQPSITLRTSRVYARIVLKVQYVNRPPSSMTVNDGDHELQPASQGLMGSHICHGLTIDLCCQNMVG